MLVGSGDTIDVLGDPWISSIPLAWWTTFLKVSIPLEDLFVATLIIVEMCWDRVAMEGVLW